MGEEGAGLTLSLSRVAAVTGSDGQTQKLIDQAHYYYGRFDNVYTGPGLVKNGAIVPLPCATPRDELAEALLIGPPSQIIDKLMPYQDLGIDRIILNVNFGADPSETLEGIQRFAEDVIKLEGNKHAHHSR